MIISQKYEVLSQIGQGSMGVVYRVRHTALETICALKVLPQHFTENPDLVKRFYREARVLARMNHPNIVHVIDIHEDKELQSHYIVMEYIEGQTLRAHMAETGPLPVRRVITLAKQVADALNYAHVYDPPVIHRDIKPTNIMIEERSGRVVVMDFGIAKDMGDSDMTKAGTVLGTLRYCPPEQMRYEDLDGSADVYALGMVIYEAHTGGHPFAGLGEYSVVARVLDAEEYQIDFPADTPPSFRSLVKRAVTKDRSKRYRSMAELMTDLDACWFDLDQTIPAVEIRPAPNLDLERERRSAQRFEEQLAEHKDRAAREGAAQLAATLFEHACALEEQGQRHFQQKEYAHARASYETALASFKEAYEEARNEASQARDRTAAAKVKADRSGAKDKARTYYSQGLALQTQADELWEHRSYSEAFQLYGEASSLFEEADVLAKNLLQEQQTKEAKEVQAQVRRARDVAVKEGVEEYAAEAFWEAVRSERQGDTALAQEDYQLAREIFSQALAQYEHAQQQARSEQQRRRAFTAQRETEQAQAGAAAEGAVAEQLAYWQAEEAHQRGDEQLTQQAYQDAVQSYQRAQPLYKQAAQEAKRARQQQDAQRARQQAERSRAQAMEAGADERFESAFSQAERYWNAGCECEQRGAHQEAQEAFEQAAQLWSQLQSDARSHRLQEEAEAAREQLVEIKKGLPSLREWATSAWATAERHAQEAETAFGRGQYADAVTLYGLTVQAFGDARSAAERDQAEQQARAAREESGRAQIAARDLEASRYGRDVYLRGQKLHQDAERALTAGHWSEAERGFREAAAVYQQSGALAKDTRVRQMAEAARTSALSAQAQVSPEIKRGVFQDKLSAASDLFEKGEQALRQQEYERARETLEQTAAAFLRIQEEGLSHLRRQHAERARAEALRLDETTADARGWSLRQARKALQQAHRSYEGSDYPQATAGYEKAAALYAVWQQKAQQSSAKASRSAKLYPWLAVAMLLLVSGGWYLSRLTPEPEPTPTPRPTPTPPQTVQPTAPSSLLRLIPNPDPTRPVVLAEGAQQSFSVRPQQRTDPASLNYRWLLDGVPQTEEASWTYAPDYDAASSNPRKVKVIVADPQHRPTEVAWGVEVVNTNQEPKLIHTSPEGEALAPKPGETISFEVQGMDPDRDDQLSYLWTLDGKRVAEDQKWAFTADPAGSRQRVQVAIVDPGGLSVSKTWEVKVAPAEPKASPLRIVEAQPDSPPDAVIALKEGGEQRFSVSVSGGSGRPLRYLWYLEGRQQATKPMWTYRPDFGQDGDKTKRIQVKVSDPQGNRVERFWQARVEDVNRPPKIVNFTPEEQWVDIASGSSRRFSIEAADQDRADPLQYAWLLDGKLLARESSFDFPKTVVPGKHSLEARVSDRAQETVTQRWSIAILAPAAPPAIETKPPRPPSPTIQEAEVKAWLASYKSAWENKNINALIGLGEVTNANAEKLRGVLAGYGDFRVELKELQIQIDGAHATVSFQREDMIDGKKLVQPGRKGYVFVKQANGNLNVTKR
ncbi:MAG: protein kinase domain-containing protein [Gammaproteobacteria bacterium]